MFVSETTATPAAGSIAYTSTIQPGDWVLVTRWTEREADVNRAGHKFKDRETCQRLFRGMVKMTPFTTPKIDIFTDDQGRETGRRPRLPLLHVTAVTLLETDGEPGYSRHPDLLLNPDTQAFSIEPFDSEAKLVTPSTLLI